MMNVDKITFNNGLNLVLTEMPGRKSASVGVWFKTGGRYENSSNKGIAHFLEHMIFKGSRKYSTDKIKRTIEGLGGNLNGFTSEELTCYLAKVPFKHAELTLEILSDISFNPKLEPKEIEKERSVILEEIKMYKDHPAVYVNELLDKLMWPDNPLGDPIIGNEKTLLSLKREDLLSFKNEFYNPLNTIISVSGALKSKDIFKRSKNIFSGLKPLKKSKFIPVKNECFSPRVNIFSKNTEQTHLAIGLYGLARRHKDRYVLSVLNVILGGNMSSRLFDKVREKKGLAYEIASVAKYFQDTGMFEVHSGVKNENMSECIKVVLNELARLKKEYVTKDELKRAKEFYSGQLELALEDSLEYMLWSGEAIASEGKVDSIADILKSVSSVNEEDIKRVANFIFNIQSLRIAVIGPQNKESENKLLKNISL